MANLGRTQVTIDVASVTRELQKMVDNNSTTQLDCSIFRVPNILSRHNPKAYEPNAFSIGPFHHNKPHLQHSQQIKVNYLKSLLSRRTNTVALQDLILSVSEIQETAHGCYAGPTGMSGDDLVQTLVLDGCFLIEFLLRNSHPGRREKPDPIFSVAIQIQYLYHDLILLENQIPWIVLNRLYDMTRPPDSYNNLSLVQLAIRFFRDQSCLISNYIELNHPREIEHILDLLRSSMVFPFDAKHIGIDSDVWENKMPPVSTLKEGGIRFKTKNVPLSILDLRFDKGVLEIPELVINEHTEPLFRNLISYEQCRSNCQGIVTSYAILLDNLINTEDDMEILGKYGVIRNWLNTEDSTNFFNQLYDGTNNVNQLYYTELIKNVNKYRRHCWPKFRTVLMRDYFNHPQTFISVVAATMLLTLAFLQTVFTIIN